MLKNIIGCDSSSRTLPGALVSGYPRNSNLINKWFKQVYKKKKKSHSMNAKGGKRLLVFAAHTSNNVLKQTDAMHSFVANSPKALELTLMW